MKKISVVALVILLFSAIMVSANTNMTIDNIDLDKNILTVEGKVSSTVEDYVMISIKNKKTDEEIYVNQIKNKNDGSFKFTVLADEFLPTIYEIKVNSNLFPDEIKTVDFNFDPSKDNTIKSFSLGKYRGSVKGNTIEVKVPESLNLDGAVAKFDVHEKATLKVNDVVQESGVTRNNFNRDVTYSVIAENKDVRNYNIVIKVIKENKGGGSSGGGGGGTSYVKPGNTEDKPVTEIDFMKDYKDIDGSHWAYPYFKSFINMGIKMGDENKNLNPDNNIKREEFVKFVVSVFKLESKEEINFKDVSENDWFYPYIKSAYGFNIIKGMDEENFGIGKNITREDIAVMLYRVSKDVLPKNKNKAENFKDEEEISSYAKEAIHILKANNIISGFPDNTFGPKKTATRAESIAMLYKLYNLIY